MSQDTQRDHRRAADYFDRKAELFDSLYSLDKTTPVMRFLNRHFRSDIYGRYIRTVDHVKSAGAQSVLDVGIGSGRYCRGYAEAGVRRVVGVDISSSMLDLAREYVKSLSAPSTQFELVLCDIDGFVPTERFDVVVAMGFFDYISTPVESLKKLRGLCNHSVIASFPSISFYRTPIRRLRYIIKKCPVYFYRQDQIEQLARAAGFSECDIVKLPGAGMDYVAILKP